MSDITIISLTDRGKQLAQRLIPFCHSYQHLHCPDNFTRSIQDHFRAHRHLICICAVGIVVRTLAPVLQNKKDDPPVLVLDEHGLFVIPLLGAHQAGGNNWAGDIANVLDAQCVITSVNAYQSPYWIAGMGCDRGCPQQMLYDLLHQSLNTQHIPVSALHAIATLDRKQNEPGLIALAEQLGIPLVSYSASELRHVEDQLSEKSDIVFREVGCYGVAEAAALVHAKHVAKNNAELVINKRKNSRATFALARSYITP